MNTRIVEIERRIAELEILTKNQADEIKKLKERKNVKRKPNTKHSKGGEGGLDLLS